MTMHRSLGRTLVAILVTLASLAFALPARAALILTGGLTLLEEGPVAATAGDPVPGNAASGGTPIAHGELSGFGRERVERTRGPRHDRVGPSVLLRADVP